MDTIDFDLAQTLEPPPAVVIPAAEPPVREWELVTPDDDVTEREIAFQVLNALDAVQTIAWCNKWAKEVRCEANPLVGKHPSTTQIILGKAVSGVVHYVITDLLRDKHSEWLDEWQIGTIVIQGGVVAYNMTVIF